MTDVRVEVGQRWKQVKPRHLAGRVVEVLQVCRDLGEAAIITREYEPGGRSPWWTGDIAAHPIQLDSLTKRFVPHN